MDSCFRNEITDIKGDNSALKSIGWSPKYNIEEISVKDLKYIKELFHMPLFIILNEYCEIYDKTNIQEVYYIK